MSPLRPTAEIAPRALLPGDPGRALALAQALLERPLMANHHRGLWGYTGVAADGAPLTVQSTGIGGPSAAAVVAALAHAGVTRAVRIGTATGGPHPPGTVVIADRILADDGTSRALGAGPLLQPDAALLAALAGPRVELRTTDLPAAAAPSRCADRTTAGALAACAAAGVAGAAVLVITDGHLSDEALAAASERAAGIALAALRT